MARNPKKKKGVKKVKEREQATTAAPPVVPPTEEQIQVWQPGVDEIEDGEELQFDPTAYDCLHAFHLGWPCLSFDIVRDALGVERKEFPHTMFCVAGTQADVPSNNTLNVVRLSNVTGKKQRRLVSRGEEDDDSESESESESDEDEDVGAETGFSQSKKPSMQLRRIAHQGGVNRIRALPQQPHIVATWADTGYVQVWDVGNHLRALSDSSSGKSTAGDAIIRQAPIQIFTGHKDEGFAIDWSPVTPGRLLTGDFKSGINLWEPTSGGKWKVDQSPFRGHAKSVEDLQWSPTEPDVFASCSADGTIRIWDTRDRNKSVFEIKAHDADVNVISWNRTASCMIASGSDDNTFRIWDLREIKETPLVAHFKYHTAPITSIEWSPVDASMLAVASEDNQLTVWDLSLERDAEEEAEFHVQLQKRQAKAPEDLPPQLLFVHLGQKDLKEVHWHPQIKGMLVSTAGDGFNILRPSNLDNLPAA